VFSCCDCDPVPNLAQVFGVALRQENDTGFFKGDLFLFLLAKRISYVTAVALFTKVTCHGATHSRHSDMVPSIVQDDRGTVRPLADRHDSAIAVGRDADETGDPARSGDDAPRIAVPVLGKWPQELVSHRPDIVGGDGRDCYERIVALRVRLRAGDDAPARNDFCADRQVAHNRVTRAAVNGDFVFRWPTKVTMALLFK
jgi:hypothetical protein